MFPPYGRNLIFKIHKTGSLENLKSNGKKNKYNKPVLYMLVQI